MATACIKGKPIRCSQVTTHYRVTIIDENLILWNGAQNVLEMKVVIVKCNSWWTMWQLISPDTLFCPTHAVLCYRSLMTLCYLNQCSVWTQHGKRIHHKPKNGVKGRDIWNVMTVMFPFVQDCWEKGEARPDPQEVWYVWIWVYIVLPHVLHYPL